MNYNLYVVGGGFCHCAVDFDIQARGFCKFLDFLCIKIKIHKFIKPTHTLKRRIKAVPDISRVLNTSRVSAAGGGDSNLY